MLHFPLILRFSSTIILYLLRTPFFTGAILQDKPTQSFSEQEVRNFAAFARLYGYARFFDPSDHACRTDWTNFAILGADSVRSATDDNELIGRLSRLFRIVDPSIQVFLTDRRHSNPDPLVNTHVHRQDHKIVQWVHYGLGLGTAPYASWRTNEPNTDSLQDPGLRQTIQERRDIQWKSHAEFFVSELSKGISCRVPLAVFRDSAGTLPHLKPELDVSQLICAPRADTLDQVARVALVVVAWNALQHSYPYFGITSLDWSEVLRESIQACAPGMDGKAFQSLLQRMMARLNDAHAIVRWAGGATGAKDEWYRVPFDCDWLKNDLVVTFVDPSDRSGIHRGDIIHRINGQAVQSLRTASEATIPGTPQSRATLSRYLVLPRLDKYTSATVELLEPDGTTRPTKVNGVIQHRNDPSGWIEEPHLLGFKELRRGIWYVDLRRSSYTDFRKEIPALLDAKGIIFDLRGYPVEQTPKVLSHFIDSPIFSPRWLVPIITRPDREEMKFSEERWSIAPATPHLKARTAFLINGACISAGETWAEMVSRYKIGPTLGSATAGANGNMNFLQLPFGYTIAWSGTRVLEDDGTTYQGRGIPPAFPVDRTVEGIRSGRDEVLDRALKLFE